MKLKELRDAVSPDWYLKEEGIIGMPALDDDHPSRAIVLICTDEIGIDEFEANQAVALLAPTLVDLLEQAREALEIQAECRCEGGECQGYYCAHDTLCEFHRCPRCAALQAIAELEEAL